MCGIKEVVYVETRNQICFVILVRTQLHASRFRDYYFLKYFLESVLWSYSQLASEKDMDLELVQGNLINFIQKSNSQPLWPKSILKWFPKTHFKVTSRKQLVASKLWGSTINLIFFKVCNWAFFNKNYGVLTFPLNKILCIGWHVVVFLLIPYFLTWINIFCKVVTTS